MLVFVEFLDAEDALFVELLALLDAEDTGVCCEFDVEVLVLFEEVFSELFDLAEVVFFPLSPEPLSGARVTVSSVTDWAYATSVCIKTNKSIART